MAPLTVVRPHPSEVSITADGRQLRGDIRIAGGESKVS